jgi:hypothetical protein
MHGMVAPMTDTGFVALPAAVAHGIRRRRDVSNNRDFVRT